jgi:hypothetical protein
MANRLIKTGTGAAPADRTKLLHVKYKQSIADFGDYIVTCTYGDKPLSGTDPMFLEIVIKALDRCTQQSVSDLVSVEKGE